MAFSTGSSERLRIGSDGHVSVGGSAIGTRANSLSVVGDDNSSPIASKTTYADTVFSVLPWGSSTTYIGTGTYYDDGVWVHASDNTKNALLALTGDGVHWYASHNSGSSFDAASDVPLWNASGQWDGDINTTYNINTGNIVSTGSVTADDYLSATPSTSTTRSAGLINYIYNQGTFSLTRGGYSHHIITMWNADLVLTITDASWLRGDIIDIHNIYGASGISVTGTRIYTPTGSHDTNVTFNNRIGSLRFQKYSSSDGYWMVTVL